jgi:hypothetical protein
MILSKEPRMFKSFIENDIDINPNIKKDFPHLTSGKELGLL